MTLGLYRGFSTRHFQNTKSFGLKDVELVKLDLLNHIFTRKGERVMMPNFGTRIPDMAFEPLDEITIMVVEEDIRTVVNFDPRVQLRNLTVSPDYDNNTLSVYVLLYYVELDMLDRLDLNIVFEGA